MKKLVTVPKTVEKVVQVVTEETTEIQDVEGGFLPYLGKVLVLICDSYIHSGTLTGVNGIYLELSDACIVYETGPWTSKGVWKDAQKLPFKDNVMISKIESWGVL